MQPIDRRAFLGTVAGAAAVAAFAPKGAAAQAPKAAAAGGALKKAVYVSMLPKELGYADKFKLALDVGFEGIEIGTIADQAVAAGHRGRRRRRRA